MVGYKADCLAGLAAKQHILRLVNSGRHLGITAMIRMIADHQPTVGGTNLLKIGALGQPQQL